MTNTFAAPSPTRSSPLQLEQQRCCLCGTDEADPVGSGEDFEYRTSPDVFTMVRCRRCDLLYLQERPTQAELDRIYPPNYHAYQFSSEEFGIVYSIRRRLEARRLLQCCRQLPKGARIIDLGCGDGFHLSLLRDYGDPSWQLEGIDSNALAVAAAARNGLHVQRAVIEEAALPAASYDVALLIATIEHVARPVEVLTAVQKALKPGGRVVIVTDNTSTLDFRFSGKRVWGGYHFPRHWNVFNRASLKLLAQRAGLNVLSIENVVSPVNWVYSIRNFLVDRRYPAWAVEQFSLKTPLTLACFTLVDMACSAAGQGTLLRATLQKK